MNNKTKLSSKTNQMTPRLRRNIRTAAIVLALLACVVGVLWLMRNQSLVSRDQHATLLRVQDAVTSIQLPGALVYTMVSDDGCRDQRRAVLMPSVSCEVNGRKLYTTQTDLPSSMHILDAEIRKHGFTPFLLTGQTAADAQAGLDGKKTNVMLGYHDPTGDITAYIVFYEGTTRTNDFTIDSLIQAGNLAAPAAGTKIYGVSFRSTYFSCTSGSILELPCPSAPSHPR